MNYFLKQIFTYVILLILATYAVNSSENCLSKFHCKLDINGTKIIGIKQCTLPAMPTFPITAPNVLNADGTLKKYFETDNTVCDVLGWMNEAVPFMKAHYGGISSSVHTPLVLKLEHLETNYLGGSTGKSEITLDTDIFDAGTDEFTNNKDPDGNIHKHRMKYITVHEFLHFVTFNTGEGARDLWLQEGMARDFEDVVYDGENPYADSLFYTRLYKKEDIKRILYSGFTSTSYSGFAFHKELDNYCSKPNIGVTLTTSLPLKERIDALAGSCSSMPNVFGDKLAGAFALYNWAVLYHKDMRKLDAGEVSLFGHSVFRGTYWHFSGSEWVLNSTNKNIKTYTLNMNRSKNDNHTVSALLYIPAFGAKSFKIDADALALSKESNVIRDEIRLTLSATGQLGLVAVRGEGTLANSFSMKSGESKLLSSLDRADSLFVTLTNTTDKGIEVEKLLLSREIEIKIDTNDPNNPDDPNNPSNPTNPTDPNNPDPVDPSTPTDNNTSNSDDNNVTNPDDKNTSMPDDNTTNPDDNKKVWVKSLLLSNQWGGK